MAAHTPKLQIGRPFRALVFNECGGVRSITVRMSLNSIALTVRQKSLLLRQPTIVEGVLRVPGYAPCEQYKESRSVNMVSMWGKAAEMFR